MKNIDLIFQREVILFMVLYKKGGIKISQKKYYKHYYSSEKTGICVVKRKGETNEDLIKRFKKKFSKSGISKELKERMYFEKPSNKKRRKKAQSIRALEREEKKIIKLKQKARKKGKKLKLKKEERNRKND